MLTTAASSSEQGIIQEVDIDNDGEIDFGEFVAMMTKSYPEEYPEEKIKEAFRVFDRDGNGFFSTQELQHVAAEIKAPLTDQQADAMIRDADVDGDGQVNYEEFVKLMPSADNSLKTWIGTQWDRIRQKQVQNMFAPTGYQVGSYALVLEDGLKDKPDKPGKVGASMRLPLFAHARARVGLRQS